jgi:outer membrane protein assembly factor BamA
MKWICFAVVLIFTVACNVTSHLQPGQYLYDGSSVKIKSSVKLPSKKEKELKAEMKELLRPKPNSSFLGIRFNLWVYNVVGEPKKKGLRNWLKNKVGEPPVLASMSVFEKNRAILQNRLENRGYFHDSVTLDTTVKNKKMTAIYATQIGPRYTIRSVSFPDDTSAISKRIQESTKRSLLKPGDPYDLDVIKNERSRIDNRLKQRGYYYFSPDNLLVLVDSTVGNHQVDIRILVKRSIPAKAKEVYSINDVMLFADYNANTDTNTTTMQSKTFDGYKIIDPEEKFRPIIFSRALAFKPGDLYNRKDQELSLNRLINLGVFKFVKVRFEETDTAKNKLNTFYYLTPTENKSLRFQVSGLTKSDDANGGLVTVTWRHRNFFRGAELFTASVYAGLEGQYVGVGQSITTSKIGTDLNLFIPKIISPFNLGTNNSFVPKTRINLGYEYYNRTTQYTLNSAKVSFGYVWRESVEKEHQLNIMTINLVSPSNITPEFQAQLDTNLTLARSIERQFIIGPNYNYNFNTQLKPSPRRNNFYFNANLDLSANLLGWITGADVDKGKQKEIFNTPFSQYARLELDFRHYYSFSKNTVLASRATGGLGYAYGNSTTMPFIKEFFAGGANDLRAFRSRSIGPGSYYAGNRDTAFLPDQPGDIKIEMNTELRFKIFSVFRWAFFVDAGNIWTRREDTTRPGSVFTKNFLQQVAVGVGTGIRLDISILIIRLDLGIPVREPYRPEGSRWYFDSKNMVWNFAIGYPF